ncbi:TadE family type IV pilus minor pilin [Streptomyces sp. NPDC001493]
MARSERGDETERETERRWTRTPRPGGDMGSVTAEAAMVLPVLVALAVVLVWALVAAADQIRCVDAARAGARAAARSEPESAVRAAARAAAPARALVTVRREGALWRVRVEAPTPGPRALALTLSAEAAALAEDTVGAGPPADPGYPADPGSAADPGSPAAPGSPADSGPGAGVAPGDVPEAGDRAGGGR